MKLWGSKKETCIICLQTDNDEKANAKILYQQATNKIRVKIIFKENK